MFNTRVIVATITILCDERHSHWCKHVFDCVRRAQAISILHDLESKMLPIDQLECLTATSKKVYEMVRGIIGFSCAGTVITVLMLTLAMFNYVVYSSIWNGIL